MAECNCSKDSWGCPKCVYSDDDCDCMEKCTCISNYNCGEPYIEDIVECSCVNCMCGKMKCWICGKGEVPIDYEPCIFHGECKANLEGCYKSTIEEIKENGKKKRIYIGPFETCDIVGTVCSHCRKQPDFVNRVGSEWHTIDCNEFVK